MSLSQRAARGGSITIGVQILKFIVQFGGLIVLGRILSPSDYGLLAMVTAIVGIGQVVRDFGLSSAAVQARTLSRGQASNLFWINLGIGILLGALCLGLSPLLATLYNDDRLIAIASALAISFVLTGAQSQFEAHLTRGMRYAALSFSDLISQVVSLGVAVATALLGFGYWALVLQVLVQAFVLLIARATWSGWLPGLPSRRAPMRALFVYGSNLVLTQMLIYVSSNVDSVLVGAKFGPSALGFYNRAYQVLSMPLNQIFAPLTAVALPVLSRLQDDRERYVAFLRRAQLLVGYPAVALFGIVGAAAGPLIPLIFGSQWAPSAPLFQIMAVGGVFQAVNYVAYWVFLSLGLTGAHLRYSIISRSILISCLVVGSFCGPAGVAVGYTVGTVMSWPLSLWWLKRVADLPIRTLLPGGARILILGLVGAAAGVLIGFLARGALPVALLSLLVLGVASAMGLAIVTIRSYRRDVGSCFAVFRSVVGSRRSDQHEMGHR